MDLKNRSVGGEYPSGVGANFEIEDTVNNHLSVGRWHRFVTTGIMIGGLLTAAWSTTVLAQDQATPPDMAATVQEQPPAAAGPEGPKEKEDVSNLIYRTLAARPDKTIFSPIDLPTPSRMRTASGRPGIDYWQQQADYRIEAALDDQKDAITATAHVTYTNNSPQELSYVWINLEQNIFRKDSDGSKFTPPGSRFNNRTEFDGGIDIESVRSDGSDLVYHVFDTVGRIDLPQPVPGNGGRFEFDIAWKFNIPEYGVDRMGIRTVDKGKIYEIAQWYPNICKYDDVHGWNTLPYLGQGEFYTEFGNYDVQITAPAGHVVCATGRLENADAVLSDSELRLWRLAHGSKSTVVIRGEEELGADQAPENAEPKTWHFVAEKVRSFAWTSSRATIWDAASIDWGDGTSTLVQSVYPVEAKAAWTESTQMLRHSIMHYSETWFRYPYPAATNVNGIVAGMEYPMIIFCGGDSSKPGLHGVTSHEIGHNWFPMMINSDERRYAWMDEGFNTFINTYDRFDRYNKEVNGAEGEVAETPFSARGVGRLTVQPGMQPMNLPADHVRPELLGALEYNKTAVALRMLREVVLGPERFDPAFKEYIAVWSFKSPQPADFFRCIENGTGAELSWFWRSWFIENTRLDQAIVDVTESTRSPRARIQVANKQDMVMPVLLRIEFDDNTSIDHTLPVYVWNYTNLWTTEIETHGKKIVKVSVDPDRKMPDSNRLNNTWRVPSPTAENKPAGDEKKADGDSGDGD